MIQNNNNSNKKKNEKPSSMNTNNSFKKNYNRSPTIGHDNEQLSLQQQQGSSNNNNSANQKPFYQRWFDYLCCYGSCCCCCCFSLIFSDTRAVRRQKIQTFLQTSMIWKCMIGYNTIILLFGGCIRDLFLQTETGDIVFNVLFIIAMIVFSIDIGMRIDSEPHYFNCIINNKNRRYYEPQQNDYTNTTTNNTTAATSSTTLAQQQQINHHQQSPKFLSIGSFLFWCDLLSTLVLTYEISWFNPRRFESLRLLLTVDQYGIPLTSSYIQTSGRNYIELDSNYLFACIGKTARMARTIRSPTVVQLSSKVNWYFFSNLFNLSWWYRMIQTYIFSRLWCCSSNTLISSTTTTAQQQDYDTNNNNDKNTTSSNNVGGTGTNNNNFGRTNPSDLNRTLGHLKSTNTATTTMAGTSSMIPTTSMSNRLNSNSYHARYNTNNTAKDSGGTSGSSKTLLNATSTALVSASAAVLIIVNMLLRRKHKFESRRNEAAYIIQQAWKRMKRRQALSNLANLVNDQFERSAYFDHSTDMIGGGGTNENNSNKNRGSNNNLMLGNTKRPSSRFRRGFSGIMSMASTNSRKSSMALSRRFSTLRRSEDNITKQSIMENISSRNVFGNNNNNTGSMVGTKNNNNNEFQVGSAMREIVFQRVAIGIICALVVTVLFTNTELDTTRQSAMLVLHTQTTQFNEPFITQSINAARQTSIPDLLSYQLENGTIVSYNDVVERGIHNPDELRPRELLYIDVVEQVTSYGRNRNSTLSSSTTAVTTSTNGTAKTTIGQFSFRNERYEETIVSLLSTIFIIIIWFFGSQAFAGPVMILVVIPVERMVKLLGMLTLDPLGYQNTSRYRKFVIEEDEITKNTRWTKEILKGMETSFLMSTILRIGSLMKVGFGSAGAEIIRRNLEKGQSSKHKNMLILSSQGTTVSCIFLFCDIRNFTDATESLQEEVFVFTNRIAAVIHSHCSSYGGSANKNVGDAFLMSWLLDENSSSNSSTRGGGGGNRGNYGLSTSSTDDQVSYSARHDQADKALLAVVRMCMSLRYDEYYVNEMSDYAKDALIAKLRVRGDGPIVQMGFGLHAGKAVQGAIGSQKKIDATYVGESVERSEFLESSTKKYGLPMLMSNSFHNLLDQRNKRRCRKVDRILLLRPNAAGNTTNANTDVDDEEFDETDGEMMDLLTFDMDIDAWWNSTTPTTTTATTVNNNNNDINNNNNTNNSNNGGGSGSVGGGGDGKPSNETMATGTTVAGGGAAGGGTGDPSSDNNNTTPTKKVKKPTNRKASMGMGMGFGGIGGGSADDNNYVKPTKRSASMGLGFVGMGGGAGAGGVADDNYTKPTYRKASMALGGFVGSIGGGGAGASNVVDDNLATSGPGGGGGGDNNNNNDDNQNTGTNNTNNNNNNNNNSMLQVLRRPEQLILSTGPVLYNTNVWFGADMRKIRERYSDGIFFQKFNSGLQAFYSKDWEYAKECFTTLLARFEDGPSRYFLNQIEQHNGKPPRDFRPYGIA